MVSGIDCCWPGCLLDEPTNDLDLETLELLEEKLVAFTGTVLVVSHDRAFLDNVVTSVIAFESAGPREYVGGYTDWQRQTSASVTAGSGLLFEEGALAGQRPRSQHRRNRRQPRRLSRKS